MPDIVSDWIESLDLVDRVVELGWVPERDLPALLAGAELSFYLSTYEGYGLPPIESLAAGTPPIVSRGLGLDDLWPDYPFRCDRLEAAEIERVTRLALEDVALRREVAARGSRAGEDAALGGLCAAVPRVGAGGRSTKLVDVSRRRKVVAENHVLCYRGAECRLPEVATGSYNSGRARRGHQRAQEPAERVRAAGDLG